MRRLVRASVGYAVSFEGIGTVHDRTLPDRNTTHQVDATWTHITSPTTVVSGLVTGFAATCTSGVGCRANPYRYVLVNAGTTMVAARERHPDTRIGAAAAARVRHSVNERLALHGGYRLFRDSWRVTGHTVDAAAAREMISDVLLVRLELRGTVQSAASFYAAEYAAAPGMAPAHRTGDAELSRLWNATAGGRVEWSRGAVKVHARLDRMWMRYSDFPSLPARNAWIGSIGVDGAL